MDLAELSFVSDIFNDDDFKVNFYLFIHTLQENLDSPETKINYYLMIVNYADYSNNVREILFSISLCGQGAT